MIFPRKTGVPTEIRTQVSALKGRTLPYKNGLCSDGLYKLGEIVSEAGAEPADRPPRTAGPSWDLLRGRLARRPRRRLGGPSCGAILRGCLLRCLGGHAPSLALQYARARSRNQGLYCIARTRGGTSRPRVVSASRASFRRPTAPVSSVSLKRCESH